MTNATTETLTVEQWERRVEWPLAAVAVGFLVAYSVPILKPDIGPNGVRACDVIAIAAWIVFAVDYVIRVRLARPRWPYVRRHVLDLAVIALPLLRPLRLLRLVAILAVLNRGVTSGLRGRVAIYVVGASLMTVFVGGLAVLDAERAAPDPNIKTAGDAWWWALTTITTVGYGDRYPTTLTGRFVAVAIMVCGIALVGIVTASLASWLIERLSAEDRKTRTELDEVLEEVRALRAEMTARDTNRA